ncbi:MAG: MerR family DNA-binding transcriptional regulator [Propioniciclava sp.]|uniref:MerR family DNA-binding transcriptional regulator n=1 Tax=Propioniciclava sp. TaxID=2038686 RepID=UPI0039E57FA9
MLIGEVSQRSGISARMLRHYDQLGLVSPSERALNGYRQYSEDDLKRLFQVEGLRLLGLSLQEIATTLDELSFSPSAMVEQLITRTRERLAREQELLRTLEQVAAGDPDSWSDVLRTTALMRGLTAPEPSQRQRLVLSVAPDAADAAVLVEAALSEYDTNVAGALYWALTMAGDEAIPLLARALASESVERARRAVEALTKIGTPNADAALATAVSHHDALVCARAWLACGRLGEARAIPALVAMVTDGPDDVEASDALATLATEQGFETEVTHALTEALPLASSAGRQRLAGALAAIPGASPRGALESLRNDPDHDVALTASFLLRTREERDPPA